MPSANTKLIELIVGEPQQRVAGRRELQQRKVDEQRGGAGDGDRQGPPGQLEHRVDGGNDQAERQKRRRQRDRQSREIAAERDRNNQSGKRVRHRDIAGREPDEQREHQRRVGFQLPDRSRRSVLALALQHELEQQEFRDRVDGDEQPAADVGRQSEVAGRRSAQRVQRMGAVQQIDQRIQHQRDHDRLAVGEEAPEVFAPRAPELRETASRKSVRAIATEAKLASDTAMTTAVASRAK